MNKIKRAVKQCMAVVAGMAACVVAMPSLSVASESVWHWDRYGAAPYTGEIVLRDDSGAAVPYSRYGTGSNTALFGATSTMSPLSVVASREFDIGIYRTGQSVDKTVECRTGEDWKVYLSVTSTCHGGVAHNLAGMRTWATESGDSWTPHMAILVQGHGWMNVVDQACALVEAKQLCERP